MTDIPATGPALAGVSPAPGGQPEDRVLLILAAGHRNSLERDLYGLTAPPTPAQAAQVSADKLLVYQALLDALPQLPTGIKPGMLIDWQRHAGFFAAGHAKVLVRDNRSLALSHSEHCLSGWP